MFHFSLVLNKAILCYIFSWGMGVPYVHFGWWFIPGELWLVGIVVLIGMWTTLVPTVLPLTPPMRTLFSVQWLATRFYLCICHALAETLRRHQYQTPVSMYLLASPIVTGFGGFMYVGWIPMWARLWMVIPSVCDPNFFSILSLINIFPFYEGLKYLHFDHPSSRVSYGLWIVYSVLWLFGWIFTYQCVGFFFVIGLPHLGRYFFVCKNWVVLLCVDVTHFLYPFLCWGTSGFLPTPSINKGAMNILMHVSLSYVGPSFGYIPRSGIAWSSGSTMSNFLRRSQSYFQSVYTSLQSHKQWRTVLLSPHSCHHLRSPEYLILATLTSVR